MARVACESCDAMFEVSDREVGQIVLCPACRSGVMRSPGFSTPHDAPPAQPAFLHTSYLIRRKIFKFLGAAFHIYDSNGNLAFYSKQKAFKLKEDIRLYTGEDMQTEVLSIRARNIIDFSACYDVIDSTTGVKVGALKRKGLKSIIRDEWLVMDANDVEIGFIQEDNTLIALLRRFLTSLIPQSYHGVVNGQQVCMFNQNLNPFVVKILLDFSVDTRGLLDRRLGIAGAVLLCAVEGKQG